MWGEGKGDSDPERGKVLLRDGTLLGDSVVSTVSDAFSIAAYPGTAEAKDR